MKIYVSIIRSLLAASFFVSASSMVLPLASAAISINFAGNNTTAMATSETAGVVAKANWNNATGASSAAAMKLTDETGAVTNATASWTSDNTWNTYIADVAGNNRMMRGYLDNGNGNPSTVTLAGLSAGTYNIYVYADGDNGAVSRTAAYKISGPGISAAGINLTDAPNADFNGTLIPANSTSGNYVLFSNVTIGSGFTLTATPGAAADNTPRAPINGIQIIPVSVPTPDFTIAATPGSRTLAAGTSTTYTVTVGALNGFTGTVSLSASGLPAGATASFSPAAITGAGSSTLTVTTIGSTPVGTSALAFKGTSTTLMHSAAATLIVSAAPLPVAVSIDFAGSNTAMGSAETAGVVAKANWNSAIGASSAAAMKLLDSTGAVTNATASWTSDNTWNTYIADVAGNNRMMRGYLDNGNGNPSTATVAGLNAGTYNIYVYVDGDNGPVSRTSSYQISGPGISAAGINLTDAPNGDFNGTFIPANSTSGNYVLFSNVTIGSGFTLTATPGAAADNTPRAPINGIQIIPVVPDFSISATPGSQTLMAGNRATWTMAIGALNGFNGSVNLTATGVPTGTSVSFSPASMTGSGNLTFTVATSSTTPAGVSTLMVSGTSGALSHSATAPLTIVVNQPPSVSAGNAQAVTFPGTAQLSGTATDDGLPSGTLTYAWKLVSGPGTVTFGSAQSLSTTASFSTAGAYVLSLTASDSALTNSAQVTITVNAVTISMTPVSTTLAPSQTQQFTPALGGTSNTAVTWTLSPATGTISAAGLYTAPASVAATQTVTVKATSVADPSKSASAQITINPPVTISLTPASTTLAPSQTQQFTPTLGGTSNMAVTWTLSPVTGTISATGLYAAPASVATAQIVTVNATSVADPTKSASAQITVKPTVTISLTPASTTLAATQTRQFTPAVGGTSNTAVTWILSPAMGTISAAGLYAAPASVAATQTLTLTATSVADPSKSANAQITINPQVTISLTPNSTSLAATGTQQFTPTLGGTSNSAVTWTLNPALGTISAAGLYTAPASVAATQTVTVNATSVADPSKSATAALVLTPALSGYYVSTVNGNDSWSGLLPAPNAAFTDGPFRTLSKAQSAMQASQTIKTTSVRAGTYSIASGWTIVGGADNGETWQAYPGENPVLDGGGTGFVNRSAPIYLANISFLGFTIQNMSAAGWDISYSNNMTFRFNTWLNCINACISANNVNTALIDSNHINGQSPGNVAGVNSAYFAINLNSGANGNIVSHNLIENTQGGGIGFSTGGAANSNNIVDRNILRNVVTSSYDSGAIYMEDLPHISTGNQITNNIVDGSGTPQPAAGTNCGAVSYSCYPTHAIYLDDNISNVLVSGNIVRNIKEFGWIMHGGDHNTIQNNIFDLSQASPSQLGYYQSYPVQHGMASNLFTKNIVYFAASAPSALYYNQATMYGDAALGTTNNMYYSATGAGISNSTFVDSAPLNANPMFTSASTGDYSMPATSAAYTTLGFARLATDQGPLGAGSGSLTGSGNNATTPANLTSEGPTDWLHWGDASLTRKSGVTPQIGNSVTVGASPMLTYYSDARTLSWTDGNPVVAGSDVNGIYIELPQNGLSFTAPAGKSSHTLTVHAGGWMSSATLTAHLSDGSAADFVDTTAMSTGQFDRNYTLNYKAASNGQTLTITWVQNSGVGGNVNLSGAALQ